jgi:hypothetical protein
MQNNRFAMKRFLPMLAVTVVLVAIVAGVLLRRNALKEHAALQPGTSPVEGPQASSATPVGPNPSNRRITPRTAAPMPSNMSREQRAAYVRERRAKMVQASKERNEAFLRAATAKFNSEKVNPAWSSQAETRLQSIVSPQQLAAYDVDVQDMKVECKSTTCRINSTFNSSREADDWIVLYMSNVGENLPQSFVKTNTLPDGRVEIEIYGSGRR